MTYTRKPLRCPCGVETKTLKQLVEHQWKEHGVGESPPDLPPYGVGLDDVSWYDEDAFKRADL